MIKPSSSFFFVITVIEKGGVEVEGEDADIAAKRATAEALMHIYDELKDEQGQCQADYEAVRRKVPDEDKEDMGRAAGESDGGAAASTGVDSLRVLYYKMANKCQSMLSSMKTEIAGHYDRCKAQLDELVKEVNELEKMLNDANGMVDKDNCTPKEKHLAAMRVLQRLVQGKAMATRVHDLIATAEEAQVHLAEKQEALKKDTKNFEQTLSTLKGTRGDDKEVNALRAENAQLKAKLEESKRKLEESKRKLEESKRKLEESRREEDEDAFSLVKIESERFKTENEELKKELEKSKKELEKSQRKENEISRSLETMKETTQKLQEDLDEQRNAQERRSQAERERNELVQTLASERQKLRILEADKKKFESLSESQRHKIESVTESFRRVVMHGGESPHRDLSGLQNQAVRVAQSMNQKIEELRLGIDLPPGHETDALRTTIHEQGETIKRLENTNARLLQDLEMMKGSSPSMNRASSKVSMGPFRPPHIMLFLPRPECDGVYEAFNRGYPGYFLSEDSSSVFTAQIRNREPIVATLVMDPEPHTAEEGNRYKLASGTRYWLCTCALASIGV